MGCACGGFDESPPQAFQPSRQLGHPVRPAGTLPAVLRVATFKEQEERIRARFNIPTPVAVCIGILGAIGWALLIGLVLLAVMYEEPAHGSQGVPKVQHLRDVIPGPKPCTKYSPGDFNKLLKLRYEISGKKPAKWAHRPVCVRPHVRRLQAQLNKLKAACKQRGDPGCRWLRSWNQLSAYDRTWTQRISSCEVRKVWPDLIAAAQFSDGNGYYGAFQWLISTWRSAGGSGSPVTASWHEQAVRAVAWRNRTSSASQWPGCSRLRGYA